jgi:hypothetical protein
MNPEEAASVPINVMNPKEEEMEEEEARPDRHHQRIELAGEQFNCSARDRVFGETRLVFRNSRDLIQYIDI